MTDLRIGLVGAGMVAGHHLAAWSVCKGARIVGIADPDAEKSNRRASQVGVPAFASLDAMLAAVELDAVDIAAPAPYHASLVIGGVEAGLPVLCQKPLCPTAAEASLLARSLLPGARVMVHENWRWRAPYRALRNALPRLGGPDGFTMKVTSSGLLPDAPGRLPALERQPFLADMPRMLVLEILIHHLDTLSFLFGAVEIVSARLGHRSSVIRGEDAAVIELIAGGIRGTLVGDLMVPGAPPLPTDLLELRGPHPAQVDGWTLRIEDEPTRHWDPQEGYAASYAGAVGHFAAGVAGGQPFETPLSAGVRQLELVERVYELASTTRH